MRKRTEIPEAFRGDIRRATEILKAAGCTDVFLFGSLAKARARGTSDLDFAVRGCPPGSFYHLVGKLIFELDHPVDLVDLDSADPFARYLEMEGELMQVG
jgi:predicted nucleotidyltransferase